VGSFLIVPISRKERHDARSQRTNLPLPGASCGGTDSPIPKPWSGDCSVRLDCSLGALLENFFATVVFNSRKKSAEELVVQARETCYDFTPVEDPTVVCANESSKSLCVTSVAQKSRLLFGRCFG